MATIGGHAFRLFDRLPEPGDTLTHEGYRFVVKKRTGLRISQLLVQKITSSDQSESEEEGAGQSDDVEGLSDADESIEKKTKASELKKDESQQPEQMPAESKKDKKPDQPQQPGEK
jgi:putative hemolysin